MRTHVINAKNYPQRISRHLVNAEWFGDRLAARALKQEEWLYEVYFGFDPEEAPHGRRPDMVEICLVIAGPLGSALAIRSAVSGRVRSKASAADICMWSTGAYWRNTTEAARSVAMRVMRRAHDEQWTEMEIIAIQMLD